MRVVVRVVRGAAARLRGVGRVSAAVGTVRAGVAVFRAHAVHRGRTHVTREFDFGTVFVLILQAGRAAVGASRIKGMKGLLGVFSIVGCSLRVSSIAICDDFHPARSESPSLSKVSCAIDSFVRSLFRLFSNCLKTFGLIPLPLLLLLTSQR